MNYFKYRDAIRSASGLSGPAKAVANIINSHYNWEIAQEAFPSIQTLALETGFSPATVSRAINNELVPKEWLKSTRRYNNSNLYTPSIPFMYETFNQISLTPQTDVIEDDIDIESPHTDMSTPHSDVGIPQSDVTSPHSDILIDNLIDNRKDNLKDNNEIKKSEGILLDNLSFDITKYLDNDISLNKIKEEVEDKEEYFLIIKERAKLGIYG
jgi:hypothetical protein